LATACNIDNMQVKSAEVILSTNSSSLTVPQFQEEVRCDSASATDVS